MARFDAHAALAGDTLLLDCQSDLLSSLNTRFVVPLIPVVQGPKPAGRLNPVFAVEGRDYVMVTQYAAAVELRELGAVVASFAEHDREIMNALDVLLTGV